MDFILGPDVFVNASLAPGSPPDRVAQRTLGREPKPRVGGWVLARIEAMLAAVPDFKKDAIGPQMELIGRFVERVDVPGEHAPDAWKEALAATAKAAGAQRVVTDHPDLADVAEFDGVEFLSTEAWLLEQEIPPPPPPESMPPGAA